jgi:hypothetical protein
MVISTITPPCFPPLGPEGVRVFSHHLPRQYPRRLDDDDKLYCIMSVEGYGGSTAYSANVKEVARRETCAETFYDAF